MFAFLKKLFENKNSKKSKIRHDVHNRSHNVPNSEPEEVEPVQKETVSVAETVTITQPEPDAVPEQTETVKYHREDLGKLTKSKLIELGKTINIDIDFKMKKDDMIKTILANQ